jgi:hypothetical protein
VIDLGRAENIARLKESFRAAAPGQAVVIDDFRPEDAPGVASLYYAIYGDGFPLDYVYDPAAIAAANAAGDLHQMVVRTTTGEVVGAAALFRSAPGAHIMEGGGLMLLPDYRRGRTGLELPRRTHKEISARLGLWAVYGQSVCNHVTSQKIIDRLGLWPYALELEALPTHTDRDHGDAPQRTALLDQFEVIKDRPQVIFPPERYAGLFAELYAQVGLKREFAPGRAPAGATTAVIKDMAHADLARLEVAAIGEDLTMLVGEMEAARPACLIRQLSLPLTDPGLPAAVKAARARGYFLSGVLPMWRDEDSLLMQKLALEPDWGGIMLYNQTARDLLQAIRRDRDSL